MIADSLCLLLLLAWFWCSCWWLGILSRKEI